MQDDDLIAKELNKFFKNAVSTLNIKNIKRTTMFFVFFSFKTVEIGGIEKEINNINPKKTTNSNSIPSKIFKKSSKVSARVLHKTL